VQEREGRACYTAAVRTVHWLFALGVALFLGGLVFIVAGARLARRAPAQSSEVAITPTATVRQIMEGIVGPAADRVFASVRYTDTLNGREEKVPRTDDEWRAVGNDAAALVESGNLLLMKGRRVDEGEWIRMSQMMIDGGRIVLRAAEARSPDKVLEAGEALNVSCDTCHQRYQRGS
jgi:hypothetical protein